MALTPGQVLQDRYRIDELLGQGGFGAVYRAWDLSLDGPVALKESLGTSPATQKQFELEARLLFKLRHPNLPRVTDHFSLTGQAQYLVMDYVEGQDLEHLLKSYGRPFPPERVLPWIVQVCDALIYLHGQNPPIIHRDIKPANIRITPHGQAILVDFGIAKLLEPDERTITGARAVTPHYSPPEQFGMGATDARSDVYALGTTLYHLLTGRLPVSAVDLLAGIAPASRPVSQVNPAVPAAISQAIEIAMRPNRSERWATMVDFKAALTGGRPAMVQVASPSGSVAASYIAVAPNAAPGSTPPAASTNAGAADSKPAEPVQPITGVLAASRSGATRRRVLGLGAVILFSVCCTFLVLAMIGGLMNQNSQKTRTPAKTTASARVTQSEKFKATIQSPTAHSATEQPGAPSDQPVPTASQPLNQSLPGSSPAISASNAAQIQQAAVWGQGDIEKLALAPGGKEVLAAGSIGVYGYNTDDLTPIGSFPTYGWGNAVAISPDGNQAAVATWGNVVQVFNAQDGSEQMKLEGASDGLLSVAYSPRGDALAAGSFDHNAYIWDLKTGQIVQILKGHSGPVLEIAYSPDGSLLATASDDQTLRIWDADTGKQAAVLKGHTGPVLAVRFSPDGTRLASGSDDTTARVWKTSDWSEASVLSGHSEGIMGLDFSPDGATLATGSSDSTIRLWNTQDGTALKTIQEDNPVISLLFLPDGKRLVANTNGTRLHLRQVSDGALLAEQEDHLPEGRGLAITNDGKNLLTAWVDWQVRLSSALDGSQEGTWNGHHEAVNSVAIAPDQNTAASGAADGQVILWDAHGNQKQILLGHTGAVRGLAFSPDSKLLASAAEDGNVILWQVSSGAAMRSIPVHDGGALAVAFSPLGRLMATAGNDQTVKVWDFASHSLLQTLQGHTGAVSSLAFSPDGQILASGSKDGRLGLWRVSDGERLNWLDAGAGVLSVVFSPDGNLVAAGLENASMTIWEVKDGTLLASPASNTGPVNGLVFSPDGRYLYNISSDGTIRAWGLP